MSKKIIIAQAPTHPDGVQICESTDDKLGFLGTEPILRPSGAAQAAAPAGNVANAAGANPTQAEFNAAVAQINALTALCNAQRLALVNLGLIKGAA